VIKVWEIGTLVEEKSASKKVKILEIDDERKDDKFP
jgi:hypothetical protein